jgi:hypothetical protein
MMRNAPSRRREPSHLAAESSRFVAAFLAPRGVLADDGSTISGAPCARD